MYGASLINYPLPNSWEGPEKLGEARKIVRFPAGKICALIISQECGLGEGPRKAKSIGRVIIPAGIRHSENNMT
jgi:hypothetical protein